MGEEMVSHIGVDSSCSILARNADQFPRLVSVSPTWSRPFATSRSRGFSDLFFNRESTGKINVYRWSEDLLIRVFDKEDLWPPRASGFKSQ